jgi:3-oxoacyl-[acyl-carrier protein] reductase
MSQKTILITGGSRGLGLVIVKTMLDRGWRVVSVQRKITGELRQWQTSFGQQLDLFEYDLAKGGALEEAFRSQWLPLDQPVDGLVNNAAIAYDDLLTNWDSDRYQQMEAINVRAPMLLTKMVIRRMLLHRQSGSLVHISSIAAHTGFKGLAMYGSTKGALESFSRGVAREWGTRQIRSNCVVPGFMETDMSQSLDEETRQKIYRRNALRIPTDPACVASMVVHLLSDESRCITGQNIFVDGGQLA